MSFKHLVNARYPIKEQKSFDWVLFVLLYILAIVLLFLGYSIFKKEHTEQYCGIVEEKYILSKYRHKSDFRLVFYSTSIKRKINIVVTPNTYSNSLVGESVCFQLNEDQIK